MFVDWGLQCQQAYFGEDPRGAVFSLDPAKPAFVADFCDATSGYAEQRLWQQAARAPATAAAGLREGIDRHVFKKSERDCSAYCCRMRGAAHGVAHGGLWLFARARRVGRSLLRCVLSVASTPKDEFHVSYQCSLIRHLPDKGIFGTDDRWRRPSAPRTRVSGCEAPPPVARAQAFLADR